jgi:hypothetical protein
VQGLVDAAMVVVAVIVPTLNSQCFKEIFQFVTPENNRCVNHDEFV